MRFLPKDCGCECAMEGAGSSSEPETDFRSGLEADVESHLLRTVGWVSAAVGAVALGMLVGRELRQRYKFSRRTPYDLYAHAGDEMQDVDFGVGI